MNELTSYQKRYGRNNPIPGEVEAMEWAKIHRPDLYTRWTKQETLRRIKEQTPEYQEYWHRLNEAIDTEIKAADDYQLLQLNQVEGPLNKRIVKNAYRRAARKLHPDAGGSDTAFKTLHEAYRRVLAVVPAEG